MNVRNAPLWVSMKNNNKSLLSSVPNWIADVQFIFWDIAGKMLCVVFKYFEHVCRDTSSYSNGLLTQCHLFLILYCFVYNQCMNSHHNATTAVFSL